MVVHGLFGVFVFVCVVVVDGVCDVWVVYGVMSYVLDVVLVS